MCPPPLLSLSCSCICLTLSLTSDLFTNLSQYHHVSSSHSFTHTFTEYSQSLPHIFHQFHTFLSNFLSLSPLKYIAPILPSHTSPHSLPPSLLLPVTTPNPIFSHLEEGKREGWMNGWWMRMDAWMDRGWMNCQPIHSLATRTFCLSVFGCLCVFVSVAVCVCLCLYLCVFMSVSVCVCVYFGSNEWVFMTCRVNQCLIQPLTQSMYYYISMTS